MQNKKDESQLPRTAIQAYITDSMKEDLDILSEQFSRGNRTEFVRQCLAIGIKDFKKKKDSMIYANKENPL